MTRAKEIKREMERLQAELDGLAPMDAMGIRELGRAAGVSPTTALRAKRGEILSYENMRKLLPFMADCPCCKRPMSDKDRKAAADTFRERKN